MQVVLECWLGILDSLRGDGRLLANLIQQGLERKMAMTNLCAREFKDCRCCRQNAVLKMMRMSLKPIIRANPMCSTSKGLG